MQYMGMSITIQDKFVWNTTKRTWREWLFTRPWKPWVSKKKVPGEKFVKDGEVLQMQGRFIMNSATYKQLRMATDE